jgi:peroxiredoxin/uncharacterized membrane protein YuzA (DUF378 family)
VTLVGSFVLMIWHRSILSAPSSPEGLLSRDGMFYLTLILFVTLTVSVFVGSVLPTITEAFTDQRFEAGSEWFDRVTGPQFAALVLVMGICPLLGRTVAAMRRLRSRGIPGLLGAAMLVIVVALAGFTRLVSLIGFAFIGLAGMTALTEYFRDAAARSQRAEGENFLQALGFLFGRNRRKYGGYLVHVGVLLMALGIVGTRMYPFETELVLSPGEPANVQDYTLVFEGLEQEPAEDHLKTWASLSVYRNGDYLATLRPQMEQYTNIDQTVAIPALRAGLREDLYLVLAGWGEDGAMATIKVHINSLASFLWLGSLVFLIGGAIALWPPAQAVSVSAPRARRWTMGTVVGVTAGALLLIAAGIAMWGTGLGEAAQPTTGRPLPGQPAPDFVLNLLDGSQLTLSDLRGQVVVINFWATWCSPCEDEMPDLQAVWDEYQADGVAFVGVAYEDTMAAVKELNSRFGITYPQGIDVEARISTAYGITGVPETFLVDSRGKVAFSHIGQVTATELREELDSLLGR